MERQPCIYLLASRRHGTIYTGVTSDPNARFYLHREGIVRGFTRKYAVKRLVYFEMAETMEAAIAREKQIKAWRREWKIALIERENPHWEDLAVKLGFDPVKPHPSTLTSGRGVHGS